MRIFRPNRPIHRRAFIAAAALSAMSPVGANAAQLSVTLAPATTRAPAPNLAVLFDMSLKLADRDQLSQALLEAGVDAKDVVAASDALGNAGPAGTGCSVKVTLSKATSGGSLILQRLVVTRGGAQRVIERRNNLLSAVDGVQGGPKSVPIV